MNIRLYISCFIAGLLFASSLVYADEVTLPYQGLKLNANLEIVADKKLADGVILITHAGLGHREMETITYLQALFKEKGYNTLAINLSLGLNNRHGMFDCKNTHSHRYADAANEIGAWMDWLKGQGAKRVTLLGHSRGAGQTALYAAEQVNTLVNNVVLLAPDTRVTNDAVAYEQRHHNPLAPILEKAQKLVRDGKGSAVLEHTGILYCPDTSVTADTITSYYGPDPRLDTPYLIPKIKKPTMIVIAGNDEVVIGYNKKFEQAGKLKNVRLKTIDGADHFFRDLYADEAVAEIDAFLKDAAH